MPETIYDPSQFVAHGEVFRAIDDGLRLEAFIPPAGDENHAANLAFAANGDLLCAWFCGSSEGQGDIRIALSRLPLHGAAWSEPVCVSDDPTRSEQNPVLFQTPQGPLWLLYTAQETRGCTPAEWRRKVAQGAASGPFTMQGTAIIRRRLSSDHGATWGPVEPFAEKAGSFCRQPPLVLANGDWLLGLYYSGRGPHNGDDYSVVWRSDDQGLTWQERPIPGSRGRVQASLVDCGSGHLAAFMRSRAADRIYVSRSADSGATWSPAQPTTLPNNNASMQALRLASGALAMVYNDHSFGDDPEATLWPGGRYPLTIALSEDHGETWPWRRHIDQGDGFCGPIQTQTGHDLNRALSYPSIAQSPDGQLHIAYSYRGRQCIKYVRLSEGWIRGETSSRSWVESAWMRLKSQDMTEQRNRTSGGSGD